MWLASEDSSFVTGEILNIDGGISLAKPNYKQWIEESVIRYIHVVIYNIIIGNSITRTAI